MRTKHTEHGRCCISMWFCLVLVLSAICVSAAAEQLWRTKAKITADASGMVEAILPSDLIQMTKENQSDLILTGPDKKKRAFELYWREPVGEVKKQLISETVFLDNNNTFVWEAPVPDKIVFGTLLVNISGQNFTGQIDVYGHFDDGWKALVENAAVYKTADTVASKIVIPEDAYDKIRLYVKGYDTRIREALIPIKSVYALGKTTGKDYFEDTLPLPFARSRTDDAVVIDTVLPGKGLWITSLAITTEAQFQGDWEIGNETISKGQKQFVAVKKGRQSFVDHQQSVFTVELDQKWQSRSLVVKLHTGNRYIGTIKTIQATVNLPRLVFMADKPGTYTAYTGTGEMADILRYPGDKFRTPDITVSFGTAEKNALWRVDSLVEKYQLKGGGFDPAGYTWRAPTNVPEPGYYRLVLNLEAGMDPNRSAIRIVKENAQVPYISGRIQSTFLDLSFEPVFDQKANRTVWEIELPKPSKYWQELVFHSKGIFKRNLRFMRPKPGSMGWQLWQNAQWENRNPEETAFHLNLRHFPDDASKIRLEMDHGDNQPVDIHSVQVRYASPSLYFLAHSAGVYDIFGGNPDAKAPQYDLTLVENELLSVLPGEITMGDIIPAKPLTVKHRLLAAFKDTGWGLYAILALVTLVMIVIVIRLFPKAETTNN